MRHKYISPASPASNPFQLRWIDVANKIPSKLQGCRMRLGLIVCGLKLWIRQNASKIPWYLWTPLQCFLLQSCTADCAYPQRSCTIFSADMKKTEILVTKNGLCTRGRKSLADSSTEKGGLLSASAYKWLHYLLIYVDIYIYIYIIYVIYRDIYIYLCIYTCHLQKLLGVLFGSGLLFLPGTFAARFAVVSNMIFFQDCHKKLSKHECSKLQLELRKEPGWSRMSNPAPRMQGMKDMRDRTLEDHN